MCIESSRDIVNTVTYEARTCCGARGDNELFEDRLCSCEIPYLPSPAE